MRRKDLVEQIKKKSSFLCVGLDTDITRIPNHLLDYQDPVFEFNKKIIDATNDLCVAYKPNLAFYECLGSKGWDSLVKTIEYIPDDIFLIADAKRGDIGNTSTMYARAFFENMHFDAITVSPYMGVDSVKPFLEFDGKWVIILGLTSNKGSQDFQYLNSGNKKLYEHVLQTASSWGNPGNCMFVIGATHPEDFKIVRTIIPESFLLVPGVGAQGGDLQLVCKFGMTEDVGLLVNSSRSIIYASNDRNFEKAARKEAMKLRNMMRAILRENNIV